VSVTRVLDPAALVRLELRALPEYNYAPAAEGRHKLDQNEVPWELPRWVKREVARRLVETDWARYPDFHADGLRREIGRLHGWPAEGVLVGNGSNELLALALEALAPLGGEVLGAEPCFGLYRMFVTRAGARPRFLPARQDLRLPLADLEREIEADPRRPLLLASPNNPTGEALSPREVLRLLERLRGPLLLDNAYGEFCRHDYRPLLAGHPHLVLFRTFSKAWSLAGLRLGYLLAHPDLVRELIKVKLPYNLGHAGAIAGQLVLGEAQAAARRRVAVVLGRREGWARMLRGAGCEVFPSEANFLLVRFPSPAAARRVKTGLAHRGILVREVGAGVSAASGLSGCLRISIGGGAALRATRQALAEIQAETGGEP
jgi:histidinol-phosphate aminotransferase